MTISAEAYFASTQPPRKKEPRYLAVIDRNSCTSCNACATVCPVDCIYEIVGAAPSQSYHAIDTSRCIGCQLCYRIPSESTQHYTLELCPWNAIDLLHNPNLDPQERYVLERHRVGSDGALPWGKLDEIGFQLLMNGEVRLRPDSEEAFAAGSLGERQWGHGDDVGRIAVQDPRGENGCVRFTATDEGHELLQEAFADYANVFLD